jgi:hypothetical protein
MASSFNINYPGTASDFVVNATKPSKPKVEFSVVTKIRAHLLSKPSLAPSKVATR